MNDEFKANRQIDSKCISFNENDSKLEKIAVAFLNSFERFSQSMISFFEHQRKVNEILVNNHLKKLQSKKLFFFHFFRKIKWCGRQREFVCF